MGNLGSFLSRVPLVPGDHSPVRLRVIVAGGSVHKIRREMWTRATFSCCAIPTSSGVFVLIEV